MADEDRMAEVAVVIPAYRAAATIGKAVQSCLDDSAVADIVVVMDGPDPALEAAIPKADRVRVIVNPSTFGAPAARNIGMRAVNAEFILFLDADDYVEDGLIGAAFARKPISCSDLMHLSCRRDDVSPSTSVKQLGARTKSAS